MEYPSYTREELSIVEAFLDDETLRHLMAQQLAVSSDTRFVAARQQLDRDYTTLMDSETAWDDATVRRVIALGRLALTDTSE